MPGAPGGGTAEEGPKTMEPADKDTEAADEGMQPAQGKERLAEEEKRKVEAARPNPGTLSRGALGPRKRLPFDYGKKSFAEKLRGMLHGRNGTH